MESLGQLLSVALLLLPLDLPDVQAQIDAITVKTRTPEVEAPTPTPPPPPVKPVERTTAPQKPAGGVLACIRSYEQGAAGYRTNTGNGYFGAYQFDLPTWRSVGGTGYPHKASVAEQDKRASILLSQRGLQPWPSPEKFC